MAYIKNTTLTCLPIVCTQWAVRIVPNPGWRHLCSRFVNRSILHSCLSSVREQLKHKKCKRSTVRNYALSNEFKEREAMLEKW